MENLFTNEKDTKRVIKAAIRLQKKMKYRHHTIYSALAELKRIKFETHES